MKQTPKPRNPSVVEPLQSVINTICPPQENREDDMEKHTPGPWWEEPDSYQVPRIWARMSDGEACDVACTEGDGSIPFDERRANARLIAAAPELLEACEFALLELSLKEGDKVLGASQWEEFKCKAKAAIAKAKGKQ